MDHHAPAPAPPVSRKPRRCTADYRWTQPKVVAFLEALSQCGQVAEAARAVGMSRTSAYRLRARMASARFDAAFEGARRSGIRARAAASMARIAARSPWEGPGLAEMIAKERTAQGDGAATQGGALASQGDTRTAQGDTRTAQGCASSAQGDAFARKGTKTFPGPCNTRSMSRRDGL